MTAESLDRVTGVTPEHTTVQYGNAADPLAEDAPPGDPDPRQAPATAATAVGAPPGAATGADPVPGTAPPELPAQGMTTRELPAQGIPAQDLPARDLPPTGHLPARDLPPFGHLPPVGAAPAGAAPSVTAAGTLPGQPTAGQPAPGQPTSGETDDTPRAGRPVDRPEHFEALRAHLLGLAYRMLGEAGEAERVVHEAHLRWQRAEAVDVPRAWLIRLVADLSVSRFAAARARREQYVGSWLPEPVRYAETRLGPLETAGQRESLSLGVLVLLERLAPAERLAFVLREAFGHSDAETARLLRIEEADVRHLHHRARAEVGAPRRRPANPPEEGARIVGRFLAAVVDGDAEGLEQLLTDDVMAWFDGGGKVGTPRRPAIGSAKVARHLIGWAAESGVARAATQISAVNGEPAVLVHESGVLTCVIAPELVPGRIVGVRTIANPDKLAFAAAQRG
ncbi:sigma factor-like helix-turn-helix DNA-binding protein [Streptomyces sp. NPDC018031]|uniref:sigma factor-like helix-turn-helix DNA-binding protein n=1 Tax=Streptomyces sp. NPDC018031 TaxID=3365033 RepID=UPI003799F973